MVETTFAALDCFSSIAYCIVNFIVTCGVKHKTKLNIFFEYFLSCFWLFFSLQLSLFWVIWSLLPVWTLLGKNVLGKILVVNVYSRCTGLKYTWKKQLVKDFGGEWAALTLFRKLWRKVFLIYFLSFARTWRQKRQVWVERVAGKASYLN